MIRFVRWLPALAWMALIFVLSDQPVLLSVPDNALLDIVFKKSAHIFTYAILMGLVLWALGGRGGAPNGTPNRPHTLLAFALVLAYAASDEFHQSFVPGRTSRWTDVAVFDLAGACIGWLAWHRRYVSGRSVSVGRSRIAWLYAGLFAYAIALAILFNLPYDGRAEQDPSPLLTDTWFLWGFSYFGLLLMPVAALLIEDGARRGMRREELFLGYVIPYFVLGILPLSLFMARRPSAETQQNLAPRLQRMLEMRWFWWLIPLSTLAISLIWLPQGSLAQLINTMGQNTGFWFMWLDIPLNHLVALPLLQADMRRRGVQQQKLWLVATLLSGPIGLGIYMAIRQAAPDKPVFL
jgi:VanZ family protein